MPIPPSFVEEVCCSSAVKAAMIIRRSDVASSSPVSRRIGRRSSTRRYGHPRLRGVNRVAASLLSGDGQGVGACFVVEAGQRDVMATRPLGLRYLQLRELRLGYPKVGPMNSPHSPSWLAPQHSTAPPVLTPQVWNTPALTDVKEPPGGVAWPMNAPPSPHTCWLPSIRPSRRSLLRRCGSRRR